MTNKYIILFCVYKYIICSIITNLNMSNLYTFLLNRKIIMIKAIYVILYIMFFFQKKKVPLKIFTFAYNFSILVTLS